MKTNLTMPKTCVVVATVNTEGPRNLGSVVTRDSMPVNFNFKT